MRFLLARAFCFGMDWNEKSPFQWDWENHGLLAGKEGEISITKPAQSGTPIGNGYVYSSDLGNCSSKSSISASIDSSSKAGGKISGFNSAAVGGFPKALDKNKELARVEDTGTRVEDTGTSKEPLIGLKLGKRTYFENVCGGSNAKNSSSSSSKVPSSALVKKTRVPHQSVRNSRCQVVGCDMDLSGAKDYHRKHRVCDGHSKCPKVIVGGQERRFCQQCSRFHDLSEFDQKKRSCRRRLSNHNARRRKPQTDTLSFHSSRLSSPFYDDRQQMNFLLNRGPFAHLRPTASSSWEDSCGFTLTHSKGSWIKPAKAIGMDGHLNFSNSGLSNTVPAIPNDLDKLLPFKGTTAELLGQGLEASVSASNLDGAPDLRQALSLLSTNSWGSLNPGQSNLVHYANASTNNASNPSIPAVDTTVGYWQEQQTLPRQARALLFDLHNNGSQYETSFFHSGQLLSKSVGNFLEI